MIRVLYPEGVWMLGSVVDNRTFEITAAGGQDKNTAAIFKETNGPPISDTKNC